MPVQKRLLLGAVALLCGLFLVRSLHRASQVPPVYNWDMVCYVALALGYGEDDPEELHAKTYETLQRECPPAVYQELIRGGVRSKRHGDVEAFTQHLNFSTKCRSKSSGSIGVFMSSFIDVQSTPPCPKPNPFHGARQ